MTPYEMIVMEMTQRSFSYQAVYRQGGTPYKMTEREHPPYEEQVKGFARMVDEADCVLVGGASGLSAAGGGDFYYEDNASYREHFGKFAERYGFKGRSIHGTRPRHVGDTWRRFWTRRCPPRSGSPTSGSTRSCRTRSSSS